MSQFLAAKNNPQNEAGTVRSVNGEEMGSCKMRDWKNIFIMFFFDYRNNQNQPVDCQ